MIWALIFYGFLFGILLLMARSHHQEHGRDEYSDYRGRRP